MITQQLYDAGYRETTRHLANGITTTKAWFADNQLASITDQRDSDSMVVNQFTYTYDSNKRKTRVIDHVLPDYSESFAYDAEDRLTSYQRDAGASSVASLNQNWQLSTVGDWQSTTINGLTETRDHNDVHELTQRNIPAGLNGQPNPSTVNLAHDLKGNLIFDGPRDMVWDFDNRLAQATASSSATGQPIAGGTYRYDALGRRVQKTIINGSDAGVRTFICAGAQVITEVDNGLYAGAYVYACR